MKYITPKLHFISTVHYLLTTNYMSTNSWVLVDLGYET